MSVTAGTKPLRVLVVEDREPIAEAIAFLVSTNRHEVATCSCRDCRERVAEFRPHAVLIDIDAAQMSDYGPAAWIRQQANLDQPLIIGLTRSLERHRQHAEAEGVNACLVKPVQRQLLQRVLDEI